MARHVRAACCAAPGQGLEPQSRRSERRILPIERTRIAVRRRTARGTRTLITVGLSHGPLPIGLERHAIATDENHLAEVAAACTACRFPAAGCAQRAVGEK